MQVQQRGPTNCMRPTCRFERMPTFTDAGGLGLLDFCSLACAQWTESAINVARAEFTPDVEHQARRLDVLSTMLDARCEPVELTGGEHGRH